MLRRDIIGKCFLILRYIQNVRNVQTLSRYRRYWFRSSKYDKWVLGTRTFLLGHLLHSEMTESSKNWSIRDIHQTLLQIQRVMFK